jgi:hypothetical protein
VHATVVHAASTPSRRSSQEGGHAVSMCLAPLSLGYTWPAIPILYPPYCIQRYIHPLRTFTKSPASRAAPALRAAMCRLPRPPSRQTAGRSACSPIPSLECGQSASPGAGPTVTVSSPRCAAPAFLPPPGQRAAPHASQDGDCRCVARTRASDCTTAASTRRWAGRGNAAETSRAMPVRSRGLEQAAEHAASLVLMDLMDDPLQRPRRHANVVVPKAFVEDDEVSAPRDPVAGERRGHRARGMIALLVVGASSDVAVRNRPMVARYLVAIRCALPRLMRRRDERRPGRRPGAAHNPGLLLAFSVR